MPHLPDPMHTCCCASEKDSLWRGGNEPGGGEKINLGKNSDPKNSSHGVLISRTAAIYCHLFTSAV